ncbi:recombinase family protein [Mediterraneibacter gnavus]|uniref:recombinase family protein n=1 Tax=Mediterraneibacter gnavus TaxID=33038 RepID=UPI003563BEF8
MYLKSHNSFLAAIYLRLSSDDGDKAESDSIRNQRSLLQDFVSKHSELSLIEEYVDDGYSGANFERPAFQRMMENVRNHKINCIIVKDLSRLGRNYIETGRYLEKIFPVLGVRFIAVNDHYDSADTKNDADQIIVPFRNLINDAYCRDISMKIRSQLEIKRKKGEFTGSYASYGYAKDPIDKNHLVIDEYAAEIVRFIFNMKMDGYSADRIAMKLNEMGVLTPMEYKRSCGFNYTCGFRSYKDAKWCATSVLRILKNELYVGTMVQGKTRKINYKVKACMDVRPEDWVRVEGTHEPIVSREIFECVQNLMKLDTRTSPEEEMIYIFSGLLRCGDCGQNMVHRVVKKKGKQYRYYHCSTYKNKEGCTSHNISDAKLQKVVLEAIQKQIALLVQADAIMAQIENIPQQQFGVKLLDSQIRTLNAEVQKYKDLRNNLYQDMVDGIITREEYRDIKQTFTRKMERAEESIRELETKKRRLLSNEMRTQKWVEEFKNCRNIESLDRKVTVMLIKRIVIYSSDRIEIHFNHADEMAELISYAFASKDAMQGEVDAV